MQWGKEPELQLRESIDSILLKDRPKSANRRVFDVPVLAVGATFVMLARH